MPVSPRPSAPAGLPCSPGVDLQRFTVEHPFAPRALWSWDTLMTGCSGAGGGLGSDAHGRAMARRTVAIGKPADERPPHPHRVADDRRTAARQQLHSPGVQHVSGQPVLQRNQHELAPAPALAAGGGDHVAHRLRAVNAMTTPHGDLLLVGRYSGSATARWTGCAERVSVKFCLLAENVQFDVECQLDCMAFAVINGPPEVL